jgi:hypothetical protein
MALELERMGIEQFLDQHSYRKQIEQIIYELKPISTLLDEGCYLAGGFVRALLLGDDPHQYLDTRFGFGRPRGDIDIFFSDPSKASHLKEIFNSTFRSFGGNAVEKLLTDIGTKNSSERQFLIQLVDYNTLILPVEAQLDRFDFTNCAAALTRKEVIYAKRFHEIEARHLLDVKRSHSPFMGGRIIKYMKTRGLTGVTPESRQHVTDWILQALCNDFNSDTLGAIDSQQAQNVVKTLLSSGATSSTEDLLLVLGMFKTTIKEKYGPSHEVDFALDEIGRRKQHEHAV